MIEWSTLLFVHINIDSDCWKYLALTIPASPALKLALDCQVVDENFEEKLLKIYTINNLHEYLQPHLPKFSGLYVIY